MQKVMRMRVLRELKANCLRYLALGFMIMMAMFLVVTIVGSGENLTRGTEELAEETNLEDGEFTLFVPLVKDQIAKIKDMNIDLEEQFYLDCTVGNGSTIRVYKVRKSINKQKIIEGSAPINPQEVTVEKRYAIENGIKPGYVLEIGKKKYKVVGICCVSDYDGPYKAVTDTSCNSKSFGLCFMSDEDYEGLQDAGVGDKTEEYTYAYKLSGDATDDELKEYLKDIRIKSDQVDDKFFKEYWDRTGGMTDNLTSSTEKMKDATDEISEALLKLKRNNGKINEGASEIFDASLMQANNSLAEAKIKTNLTEKNYKSELDRLSADSQNGLVKYSINDAREQLDGLKSFKDGVKKYTDGVKKISKGTEKMYEGVDELDSAVDEAVDEMGVKLSNLTTFLKSSDNPRIFATKHDKEVDIHVGLLAGAILFVLMAYVISVFVVHSIENESSIIGTLYAMGVTKRDLIVHYITLPVVITTLAGIIGAGLAGTGIMVPMIAQSSYDYFSIPHFEFSVQPYLWIYSIVVPPVISALVNIIVINSKLNKTALSLIRREKKQTRIRKVNLNGMNFVTAFRIRQIFREMRSALALIAGMFIALYVFMMALNCFLLCGNIAKDYERDTKYSYMYMVKYPESEAPKSAEQAFAQTFKKETMGISFDVTLMGIDDNNPYFTAKPPESAQNVVVSSALAEKFGLKPGEDFVVTDDENDQKYAFNIDSISECECGFYVFINIDKMREMFDKADNYYNVLFSDKKLDIDSGRLYSVTSRQDVVKGASVFSDLMMPLVFTLTFASIAIFCVVMYLMMKVMIDRSAMSISLVKIFGYRRREIKKLYLDGNFAIIAVGAALIIPITKQLMNLVFPYMVSNVNCGLNLSCPVYVYFIMYAVIIGLYLGINALLVRKLDKYTPAEILKDRD